MSNRAQPDLFAPGVAEAPAFALVPSPAAPVGVRGRLADIDTLDEAENHLISDERMANAEADMA